ncbi:hypothetical protein [Streptomyces sp. NPDC006335]|uniref:hypothetical protein n=1 Tax=Streptomyces sp. NPDC006335 TaxID=3156895 RepID=UPI0033B52195
MSEHQRRVEADPPGGGGLAEPQVAVEDLDGTGAATGGLPLPLSLQGDDVVDEGRPRPRFVLTPGPAQDGGLARAGGAGEYAATRGRKPFVCVNSWL